MMVLKAFALGAALLGAGIVVVEGRVAVYGRIADRIWQSQPYSPALILDTLEESANVFPALACSTGTAVARAAIALRALEDSMEGHNDLALPAAIDTAVQAIDDGLACRPLASPLWLSRFWVRSMAEGYSPALNASFDRSIATAPYDGWMMRRRVFVGVRYFWALTAAEQAKFFEDFRYLVEMGYLDEAYTIVERLGDQPARLKAEIDPWPLQLRNRFVRFLLGKGVDLNIASDLQLRPWEHY